MLKLGDKNIKKIYQGDKLITKMYLGDKLVYHKEPMFLEYIEFDGDSYLDSEYYVSSKTKVETAIRPNSDVGICVYGTIQFNKRFTSFLTGYWRFGNTYTDGKNVNDTVKDVYQEIIQDKTGVTLNGVHSEYDGGEAMDFTTGSDSMYIGAQNNLGVPSTLAKYKGKMYYFRIYENNVLVRDFKPCINPNGIVCFYDTVTKKYFYNIGTGQFKAGGRFVKSILFDGASYIDTGIIPTNNTGAYCKLVSSAKDQTFLGSRNDTGNTRLGLICTNYTYIGFGRADYLYLNQDGSIAYKDVSDRVLIQMNNPLELWSNFNNDKKLRVKQGEIDITGQPIKDVNFTPQFTMFLGGMNIAGEHKSACTGKVLQCQITEDNTLLLDLRPFVDENEVACFYDMVTGTKFYNQGTGTLGYTEE